MNKTEIKDFLGLTMKEVNAFLEGKGWDNRSSNKKCVNVVNADGTENSVEVLCMRQKDSGAYDFYDKQLKRYYREYWTDYFIREDDAILVDVYAGDNTRRVRTSQAVLDKYNIKRCSVCGVYECSKTNIKNCVRECEGKYYCYNCIKDAGIIQCSECGDFIKEEKAVTVYKSSKESQAMKLCPTCAEELDRKKRIAKCFDGEYYTLWKEHNGVKYPHDYFYKHFRHSFMSNKIFPISEMVDFVNGIGDDCKIHVSEIPEDAVLYKGKYYFFGSTELFDGKRVPKTVLQKMVQGYHNFGNYNYKPRKLDDEETDLFFGTEIETEGKKNNAFYVIDKHDELFHCERDGSLQDGGFEIISQPMSWNYFVSKQDEIFDMFADLTTHGQVSDAKRCGLHIHVSKKAFKDANAVDRAVAIVNYFQNNIEILSRRKGNDFCAYTKLDKKVVTKEKAKPENDRYSAVNTTNSDTIEFRMFRGTLDVTTYYASIQLVKNIVEIANSDKVFIRFSDLLKGEYLHDYLLKIEEKVDDKYLLDLQGWNQNDLLATLKAKRELIETIKKFNSVNPNNQISLMSLRGVVA